MKKSVSDIFWDFNVPMEGYCTWMYPDVKGLISTGVGNLIDPCLYAQILPWKHPDGTRATAVEVKAEWENLKHMPKECWANGGGWFKSRTILRLSESDVRILVGQKLIQMETFLKGRFPDWDSYPADAQLALLSMSWALGPAFRFPKFLAHLKARNWVGCADECKMTETGNPGVIPRNKKNRQLFINAAAVEKHKLDPEKLYWPRALDVNQEPEPEEQVCPTCNGTGRVKT